MAGYLRCGPRDGWHRMVRGGGCECLSGSLLQYALELTGKEFSARFTLLQVSFVVVIRMGWLEKSGQPFVLTADRTMGNDTGA